jgi:PadR family transcriptional regulator PadR
LRGNVYVYRVIAVARVRRPSVQTVRVLEAFAADAVAWRYGYELGHEVGVKAGSLYPILMRLSDRGLLDATWERNLTRGRPPRHLYRLSGAGVELAAQLAAESSAGRPRRRSELREAW